MSIQFSDTTNYKGLAQLFEAEIGADPGYITGDVSRMKQFTADVNLTVDDYVALAIKSVGAWQYDDSNNSKYPEVKMALVQGQRDYSFTVDEEGLLILDVYRVFIKDSNGVYQEIFPVDRQLGGFSNLGFNDGVEAQGVPDKYDKTANAIILDPVPSYSIAEGLKFQINRESSQFVYTDTTKKPGVPGIHHEYFFIKPAYRYARRNKMKDLVKELEKVVVDYEGSERLKVQGKIQEYFGQREKDVRHALTGESIIFE